MSADPRVATLVANVTELEGDLRAAIAAQHTAEQALAAAQTTIRDHARQIAAAEAALTTVRQQAQQQIGAAQAAAAEAHAGYLAVSEKFDRIHGGPDIEGIRVAQRYFTDDGREHATRQEARVHLAARHLGIEVTTAARLAQRLADAPAATVEALKILGLPG